MVEDTPPAIEWTDDKLKLFRVAYERALTEHMDPFLFDGHDFPTDYAKLLLEQLEGEARNA